MAYTEGWIRSRRWSSCEGGHLVAVEVERRLGGSERHRGRVNRLDTVGFIETGA